MSGGAGAASECGRPGSYRHRTRTRAGVQFRTGRGADQLGAVNGVCQAGFSASSGANGLDQNTADTERRRHFTDWLRHFC